MQIQKKEYEYKEKICNVDAGTVVAFEDVYDDEDNYYIVNDYDLDKIYTATTKVDMNSNSIMVTNLITGYVSFVAPYKKCKVVNLEVKEL